MLARRMPVAWTLIGAALVSMLGTTLNAGLDATPLGAKRYREKWRDDGAKQNEPTEIPSDWDRVAQFEHIPEEFR